MRTLITTAADETRSFGGRLAAQLLPGDVLLLYGDMGAGKSELVRGVAKGLGVDGIVPSPTFTILRVYDSGRIPLYHFDWFRIRGAEELYELSMDEYLYGDGVAAVEWPDCAMDVIPAQHLRIRLTVVDECRRQIDLQPVGGFREVINLF